MSADAAFYNNFGIWKYFVRQNEIYDRHKRERRQKNEFFSSFINIRQ